MSIKGKKYNIEAEPSGFVVAEPETFYLRASSINSFFSKVFDFIGFIFPNATHHQESDLIPIIRKGLSKKNLHHLMDTTGLDLNSMSIILHISERTLHRYTTTTTLNPEISERIIEIAKLYAKGEDTFGDLVSFRSWMAHPSRAFDFKAPKDYLDTSLGIKLIEDELGRIEHGILS